MTRRYLVLDSDPRDDSFRWGLDRSIAALLPDLAFEYRFRRGDPELYRDIWEAAGTQAILSLVADLGTPAHYVMVEEGDPTGELGDRIVGELASVLPAIPLSDLQDRAERGEDPSAVVRLALGTTPGDIDLRSSRIIGDAFRHPEPLVRYRAAEAAGLVASDVFLARLEALAADDPDESVRGMAAVAASMCRPVRT